MNKILIFFALLFFQLTTLASLIPSTKVDFCERYSGKETPSGIVLELAEDSANLMSFKNDGGLFNQGVCWWHSRFQRNVLYLGLFRPEFPRPNVSNIIKIIRSLRAGMSVVTVPGYANFSEFSAENQKYIQSELDDWQLYDGVFNGAWIGGLQGDTSVPSTVLQKMMSELHSYVALKKKIAYEKLQIKGITSHAWLIVGMKEMPYGMDVGYIDSNSPRMSKIYSYKTGETSFFIKGYGNFVPYLEFTREENRLTEAGKGFCGQKGLASKSRKELLLDYQLDLESAKRVH